MRRWSIRIRPNAAGRCCSCASGWRVAIVRRDGPTTARRVPAVRVWWIGVWIPRVLRPRRGYRRGLRHCHGFGRFLFCLSFNLGQDRTWIHSASIEVTLEGQEIFSVMFFKSVSSARGCTDTQLRCDVLPRFIFGALKKRINFQLKNTLIWIGLTIKLLGLIHCYMKLMRCLFFHDDISLQYIHIIYYIKIEPVQKLNPFITQEGPVNRLIRLSTHSSVSSISVQFQAPS